MIKVCNTEHQLYIQVGNCVAVELLKLYDCRFQDLEANVRKIADFLEKPLSEEILKRIAEQCTFESMFRNKAAYQEGTSIRIRKGKVGDWKNYFTPEQNAIFDKEIFAKLEGTGIEFDHEWSWRGYDLRKPTRQLTRTAANYSFGSRALWYFYINGVSLDNTVASIFMRIGVPQWLVQTRA